MIKIYYTKSEKKMKKENMRTTIYIYIYIDVSMYIN